MSDKELRGVILDYKSLEDDVENKNYVSIRDFLLQQNEIDNPVPQSEVPVEVDLSEVFYLLAPDEFPKILAVKEILKAGKELSEIMGKPFSRTPQDVLKLLVEQGISGDTKTAIEGLLSRTEPDPNYQAKVLDSPRWMKKGLNKPPSTEDIMFALL